MKFVSEWNPLDTIFYKLDTAVAKGKELFFPEEPDVESIIEIETNYLMEENGRLKELGYPKPVFKNCGGNYSCPKCKTEIDAALMEQYRIKHCPECGQRIFLNKYRKAVK